jgi:hypothetical protein
MKMLGNNERLRIFVTFVSPLLPTVPDFPVLGCKGRCAAWNTLRAKGEGRSLKMGEVCWQIPLHL